MHTPAVTGRQHAALLESFLNENLERSDTAFVSWARWARERCGAPVALGVSLAVGGCGGGSRAAGEPPPASQSSVAVPEYASEPEDEARQPLELAEPEPADDPPAADEPPAVVPQPGIAPDPVPPLNESMVRYGIPL